MQVPDVMRKSVMFLYGNVSGRRVPFGTAFLTAYELPDELGTPGLLLTAQHVIAGVKLRSDDQKVWTRINTRDGAAVWLESEISDWVHADPNVDFAFMPWGYEAALNADTIGWLLGSGTLTEAKIQEEGVGLGDEVFMVGLFRNHLGRDRNEPILRVGNIAAMPVDPIKTSLGNMKAILVEARSIGGLSGSPVFVHMGFSRWREGGIMFWTPQEGSPTGPFLFLGLMHGHWDALEAEVDSFGTNEKVNMGIGIVVPAGEIMQALEPTMKEVERLRREARDEENTPTADTAVKQETEFDRFEDLTRKLANTSKPAREDESDGGES